METIYVSHWQLAAEYYEPQSSNMSWKWRKDILFHLNRHTYCINVCFAIISNFASRWDLQSHKYKLPSAQLDCLVRSHSYLQWQAAQPSPASPASPAQPRRMIFMNPICICKDTKTGEHQPGPATRHHHRGSYLGGARHLDILLWKQVSK